MGRVGLREATHSAWRTFESLELHMNAPAMPPQAITRRGGTGMGCSAGRRRQLASCMMQRQDQMLEVQQCI